MLTAVALVGALLGAPTGHARADAGVSTQTVAQLPQYNPLQAEQWFYKQRMAANGMIPPGAHAAALQQAQALKPAATPRLFALAPQAASTPPANQWVNLGPAPITGLSGAKPIDPSSGRVSSIAIAKSGTIFVGSAGGGVWSSSDTGSHWQPLTDQQPSLALGGVAVDPNNPQVIYAGTGEAHQSDSFYGEGVLKSTDSGATWTTLGKDVFGNGNINAVVVSPVPADGSKVFVATTRGLYMSLTGGKTWSLASSPAMGGTNNNVTALVMHPSNPSVLYAGVDGPGVFKTTDGGATWTQLANGLPAYSNSAGNPALAIAPSSPNVIYASFTYNNLFNAAYGNLVGLYVSKDDGGTWTQLANTPDVFNQTFYYGSGGAGQGWYDNALAVSPTDPNTVYFAGIGLAKTTDGGQTWTADLAGPNKIHPDFHALQFDAAGNLWVGSDGGVWMISPSGAVSDKNANLSLTQFYPGITAFTGSDSLLHVVGGAQDNGTAVYGGVQQWNELLGGDGAMTAVDPTNPLVMYASYAQGYIQKSTDGGQHWADITPKVTNANWVAPLVLANGTLYLGADSVWISPDRGATWKKSQIALVTSYNNNVSALTVAPSNPKVIYAGFNDGELWNTTDGGVTWYPINVGLPGRWITSLTVSPTNPYQLYVTLSGYNYPTNTVAEPHVFMTTGGADVMPIWKDITGNLPDAPVNALLINGGSLVVASDVGVFTSSDGGRSWSGLGQGMPNVQVVDLKASPDGTQLFAATHGRGMWKLALSAPAAGQTVVTSVQSALYGSSSGSPSGGDTVNIGGRGFTGATAVSFGPWTAASFAVLSDTQIQAVTPLGGGTVDVVVTGTGGKSAVNPSDQFTFTGSPTLATASPNPVVTGTPITLKGPGGFGTTPGNVIFNQYGQFNSESATAWSDTAVTVTVPAYLGTGAPTLVYLQTSKGLLSSLLPLTVMPPSALSAVSPGATPVGSLITLSGVGLGATPGTVRFAQGGNVKDVAPISWSDTSVAATVPGSLYAGPATVSTVLYGNVFVGPLNFTVLGSPAQVTLTPAVTTVSANGLSTVSIAGQVLDAANDPLPGVAVNLTNSNPTVGSLAPTTVTTGSDGSFRTTFTASAAPGSTTITASTSGTATVAVGTTTITTKVTGSPYTITLTPQSASAAPGDTVTLTGRLTDANGTGIPQSTVNLTATGGTVASAVTTGSGGDFTATVTTPLSHFTSITVTAQSGSLSNTATITESASSAASVTLRPFFSMVAGGGSVPVTVQVTDSYGLPVANAPLSLTASFGTFGQPQGTTDATGAFTATLTVPDSPAVPGQIILLRAAVSGTTVGGIAVVFGTGHASNLKVLPAATVVAPSGTLPVTVTPVDDQGRLVAGVTVTNISATGGATVSPATGVSDLTGKVSAVLTAPSAPGPVTITATATLNGQIVISSSTVNVVAVGAPASLTLSPGTQTLVSNASTTLLGTLLDGSGNPVAGATVNVTATAGTVDASAVTAANGSFSIHLTAPASGSATITASVGSGQPSGTATVNVDTPATIALTAGAASVAPGRSMTFTGTVTGSSKSGVGGAAVDATISSATYTLNCQPCTTTDNQGNFRLWLPSPQQVGPYTVTATVHGTTVQNQTTVTVTYASNAALTMALSKNVVTAGNTVTVTGTVLDNFANAVPGATLQVSGPKGSATAAVSATTQANGSYSAVLTTTQAGTWPINVSLNGSSIYASQALTVNPGAPAQATLTSSQVAAGVTTALYGVVADPYGNPVANVPLTLAVDRGTLGSSTATSGADGSFVIAYTAPTATGTVTVTVKQNGLTLGTLTIAVNAPVVISTGGGGYSGGGVVAPPPTNGSSVTTVTKNADGTQTTNVTTTGSTASTDTSSTSGLNVSLGDTAQVQADPGTLDPSATATTAAGGNQGQASSTTSQPVPVSVTVSKLSTTTLPGLGTGGTGSTGSTSATGLPSNLQPQAALQISAQASGTGSSASGQSQSIHYLAKPVSITFKVPTTALSQSTDVVIAYYNTDLGVWVELPTTVDPATGKVTTRVAHFTTFAVFTSQFSTSKLTQIPGGSLTTALVSVSGTGTAGSTITVYDDNTSIGTLTMTTGGAWSLPVRLHAGTNSLVVTATQASGTVGIGESIATYTPPVANVTISAAPNQVTVGGTVPVTGQATDQSGKPVSDAALTLSATGGSLSTASVKTAIDGTFSAVFTAPATAGNVTITAATADAKFSGSTQVTVSAPSTPNTPSSPDGTVTADVNVAAQDATLTAGLTASSGAIRLTLPQGSLRAPTKVTIAPQGVPAPSGATLASAAWSIDASGAQLLAPAPVFIQLHVPAGTAAEQLGLYTLVNGAWQFYTSGTFDAAAGTYSAALPHLGTWAVLLSTQGYSDVPSTFWAFRQIGALSVSGIASGFPDGTFQPGAPVTRAQFLRFLLSTLGIAPQVSSQQPFSDVTGSEWYAGYVDAAAQAGLFQGSGGQALADGNITRQEAVTILMRAVFYAHLNGRIGAMPANLPGYADASQIASWAQESAKQAAILGVMGGYPDGSFQPNRLLTRAEAAALMIKLLGLQHLRQLPPPM